MLMMASDAAQGCQHGDTRLNIKDQVSFQCNLHLSSHLNFDLLSQTCLQSAFTSYTPLCMQRP